jgi:hypothetical protein
MIGDRLSRPWPLRRRHGVFEIEDHGIGTTGRGLFKTLRPIAGNEQHRAHADTWVTIQLLGPDDTVPSATGSHGLPGAAILPR